MFEISPFATCWDCKLHFGGAQQIPTLAHKAAPAQRGKSWCTSQSQHHFHSFQFLFTLLRCECKSWDSIALDCVPVASKVKTGRLKIRNKCKHIQTGCLETLCSCRACTPTHRAPGHTGTTQALQSHRGRHCRCHRKAETPPNSTQGDPRKPLKSPNKKK